jgi:hypothetical protein
MSPLDPEVFYQHFLTRLAASNKAREMWVPKKWTSELWTPIITTILVEATRATLTNLAPDHLLVSAKGSRNKYKRCEYWGVDVIGCDDSNWGPPLIAVQHENNREEEEIQYEAWTLLGIHAQLRVLVVYLIDPHEQGHKKCPRSLGALIASLERVVKDHPNKSLAVIVGEDKPPTEQDGWRNVYTLHVLNGPA